MFKMKSLMLLCTFLTAACGHRSAGEFRKFGTALHWRVIGGNSAEPGQFPFVVSLRGVSGGHFCGGSIIRKKWILTAAHCVQGYFPWEIRAVAGSHLLSTGGVSYGIRSIVLNEYNPNSGGGDIALLELQEQIVIDNYVNQIDIEEEHHNRSVNVMLVGWGSTSYPGSVPDNLQYVLLETIPYEECYSIWGNQVSRGNICTRGNVGYGACRGDSGGPIFNVETYKLVGVVSWGEPCGTGYPDVYTNVAYYSEWIENKINNNVDG